MDFRNIAIELHDPLHLPHRQLVFGFLPHAQFAQNLAVVVEVDVPGPIISYTSLYVYPDFAAVGNIVQWLSVTGGKQLFAVCQLDRWIRRCDLP